MSISKEKYQALEDGIYAHMKTSQGEMLVQFYPKESPVTVANFIGLAQGKIINDKRKKGVPFYDGTIFHRVIKDFMIQGGDALGTGTGDGGYKFDDELNELKHEGKGVLSMANSGANTNGTQFFITEVSTPWLDGKHTIFGKVVDGLQVIDQIAQLEKGAQDRPKQDVVLEKVSIITKGGDFEDYDAVQVFEQGKSKIKAHNQALINKKQKDMESHLETLKSKMVKTASGLYYSIHNHAPQQEKATANKRVKVHYKGSLLNGQVFDSSYQRNEPIAFQLGAGQVIKGWDEGISLLRKGEKATLLIPPVLGYGSRGAGGVIPGNAWLLFEVELVDIQ